MAHEPHEHTGETLRGVDLREVERLANALEADLAKVRSGSADVELLRAEVDALKQALGSGEHDHDPVDHRLRKIHSLLDTLVDDAIQGARYVAEIGRMLGM